MKAVKKFNDDLQAGNAEALLNEKESPTPESVRDVVEEMKFLLKIELSKPTVDDEGDTEWRLPNGSFHRDYGPAVEHPDGGKEWFKNGKRHREDGPATEWADGKEYYFIHGTKLSKAEFNARAKK